MMLCSSALEIFISVREIIWPGKTILSPLKEKLTLPAGLFGLLILFNELAEREAVLYCNLWGDWTRLSNTS